MTILPREARDGKESTRLRWALRYAEAFGWKVFPLWPPAPESWFDHPQKGRVLACSCPDLMNCDNAGKHPIGRLAPHGVQDATNDPEMIRRWWTEEPFANIGLATGEASGVVVLDEDGPEARETLADLHVPVTPTSRTGRREGGFHRYFAMPDFPIGNRTKFLPGLDLRGTGGYVVLPPSVHATGTRYEWAPGLSPAEVAPAPMPDWLVEALRPAKGVKRPRPASEWVRLAAQGVEEGQRNDAAAKLAGHLLRKGVDPELTLVLLLGWNDRNQPPLPEDELVKTVDSIAARELERRARRRKA